MSADRTSSHQKPGRSDGRLRSALAHRAWPVATAALALAAVSYRTAAAACVGARWDTFAFLANAAAIAGKGFGYIEPGRAPLLSVVTAGPLLAFGLDERVIQVVDSALVLFGLAGFWLLLRRRFTQAAASVATIALLASPVVWDWVGAGYTDLASVGLCAWALLFFVKATEDDARWYLAAFPMLLAASLTRTSAILLVLAVGVWLLLRARPFPHAKHIAGGVALAVLAYVPFGIAYVRVVGEPLYPFLASRSIQEAGSLVDAFGEIESFATSLHLLAGPRELAALTVIVLALAGVGLAWGALSALRHRPPDPGRALLAVATVATAIWVVRSAGPMAAQLAIAAGVVAVWRLLASDELDTDAGHTRVVPARAALDAAMLVWLLSAWWFHEEWAQKLTRYYITMAPGVAYFAVLGWRELVRGAIGLPRASELDRRLVVRVAGAGVAASVLIALVVNASTTSWRPDAGVRAARDSALWLERVAPDDAVIYSDVWPLTAWYLRRDVQAMPLFADESAVGHELAKNGADFFVSNDERPVPRYRDAYLADGLRVLTPSERQLARYASAERGVLYLGTGWENYLEELDGYRTRLIHAEGDYNVEGTAFLEEAAAARRLGPDALAVYGVRWRDRSSAQRELERYVTDGGTLLIDASRNLAEPYSWNASVLFDTVITREPVARDARITVDQTFATEHPALAEVEELHASSFADEDGAQWYGAGYRELPGTEPLRVLARLDGRPLIAERSWGKGRVVWVGYNLLWHARLTQDPDEERLVRAVLDDLLSRRPAVGRAVEADPNG